MKHIISLSSTDCRMWWVKAFLKYGWRRPVVAALFFLALVCGEVLAGCSQPKSVRATTKINSSAVIPLAVAASAGISVSNINGIVYIWKGGNLISSNIPMLKAYGGMWTDIPNVNGQVVTTPGEVEIVQENVTELSIGFTYITGITGTNVYFLERSSDLENWWVVNSQDSPQTNSWVSNLIVDEHPNPSYAFYRIGVE